MREIKEKINEIKNKINAFIPVMSGLSRARNPLELLWNVVRKHDDRIQQYKQAVIEMETKYNAIIEALFKKQERDLEIEELKLDLIENPANKKEEITNKRIFIAVNKLNHEEKQSLIAITGAAKEVMDFIYIIETEFPDLIDKTEEELLVYEAEHWIAKMSKQVYIDLMTSNSISPGNLSAIESMPLEIQRKIKVHAIKRVIQSKEADKLLYNDVQKELGLLELMTGERSHQLLENPIDFLPLKLLKDAPKGYPDNRIIKDKTYIDILIASLHRPGDKSIYQPFYIPAGKNIIYLDLDCPSAELIGEYRNRIVKHALSLKAEYIFFIDDDLLITNDTLMKLYEHDLTIVGGWYPMKTPVIQSSSLINKLNSESKIPVPLNSRGLIEIDQSLAAGLTLIKTSVYKKIEYPWYLTGDEFTEDYYFTQRAKEANIKSYLDTSIQAIHIDKQIGKQYSFNK